MSESLQNKFMLLIQKHERIIYKVIGLYADSKDESQDLQQEIMLQAWRSYKSFRGDSKFSTWLYKIALNTVFNHNKKTKKVIPSDELVYFDYSPASKPAPEGQELLYRIIKRLDDIDKTIITLHLDGYKNMEVGEILGISTNHVNVKIHRIKTKITEDFKSSNHGHTSNMG